MSTRTSCCLRVGRRAWPRPGSSSTPCWSTTPLHATVDPRWWTCSATTHLTDVQTALHSLLLSSDNPATTAALPFVLVYSVARTDAVPGTPVTSPTTSPCTTTARWRPSRRGWWSSRYLGTRARWASPRAPPYRVIFLKCNCCSIVATINIESLYVYNSKCN